MTDSPNPAVVCPACSTPGTGRFCANCGTPLDVTICVECKAELGPGARFCHKCGRAVAGGLSGAAGAPFNRASTAKSLALVVGAIAVLTVLAYYAGNAYTEGAGNTGGMSQSAIPQTALDGQSMMGGGPPDVAARAPDISQLSPEERADRLYNRVMLLASQGRTDSVLFFAPMAIDAYRMLSPLNADQRYDIGRIAEVVGALPVASAQADTILRENPAHLLGLVLGARIAALSKDASAEKSFDDRILKAYDSESAKRLPEYERHADEITTALADARRSTMKR